MSSSMLIILLVVLMLVLAVLVALLFMGGGRTKMRRQAQVSDSLRSLVQAQRAQGGSNLQSQGFKKDNLALAAAAESEISRKKTVSTGRMTLEKKLRYARWPLTPIQFRSIQVIAALAFFIPAYMQLSFVWPFLAPMIGWVIVGSTLSYSISKRFNEFDKDYPVLLLSYVSLLKTGMSTIAGLEAAAKGLDPDSLVRAEVEILIERLRLGLTEEQAISSFGEDIAHPEIELFVQGLLLSRRVGGQLSSTLERLAKQVRKRQEFRKKAVAAVGMERSSVWAIAGIMTALIIYLFVNSPDLVLPAFKHPMGMKMWQGGLALVLVGFYWMRTVTNIKI